MLKKLAGTAMGALLCVSLVIGAAPHKASVPKSATAPEKSAQTLAQPIAAANDDELSAYLFVHFVGNEGDATQEQVYFSVSKNGTQWKTLNGIKPVLSVTKALQNQDGTNGTGGIRDPHIIRAPEGVEGYTGKKFYMIATDLSIFNIDYDWTGSQTNGSQSIVIWDSDDLVNWSAPRLRRIARSNATCAWAPESVWDEERQAFMVFWASKSKEDWTHRLYRCYTTDFDTFTEPEVYIERDGSRIDTTFIKEGEYYYRFTKNEETSCVYLEKSTSLSGNFEYVNTYTINGKPYTESSGYEGPTIYKLNGEDKWCLLLDNFAKSAGYKPFVTDDITTAHFTSADAFDFGGVKFRHGTVMPITRGEYNGLIDKWENGDDPFEEDVTSGELVYSLDFENNLNAGTGTVQKAATGTGALTYVDGVKGGKAVQLSKSGSGAYVTLPNEALVGYPSVTVSFAVYVKDDNPSWLFYASPSNDGPSENKLNYFGIGWHLDGFEGIRVQPFLSRRDTRNDATIPGKNQWVHVTTVFHVDSTELYINGEWSGKVASDISMKRLLNLYKNDNSKTPVAYLGRAMWGGGEHSSAAMDCFKIHNYAMSEAEVATLYGSDMGVTVEQTEAQKIYSLDIGTNSVSTGSGSSIVTTVKGTGLTYGNDGHGHNAVTFSNNNSITLSTLGLTGTKEFSVTFAAKGRPGTAGGDLSSWLFFLTENNNDTVYNSEKYLGICWQGKNNGQIRAERYYGGRGTAALESPVAQDEWVYVTVVYRERSTCLYINGQLVVREASTVNLSNLLKSTSIIQLGKANWKSDGKYEYANASLSCFEIYSGALSDSKITELYNSWNA